MKLSSAALYNVARSYRLRVLQTRHRNKGTQQLATNVTDRKRIQRKDKSGDNTVQEGSAAQAKTHCLTGRGNTRCTNTCQFL